MTPKEKAKELFDKFYLIKDERGLCRLNDYIAKHCALIAVDEILSFIDNSDFTNLYWLNYWIEVKEEINKL
jgi:hypothetical protein